MRICAELEVSCFPDNGKTISQLIKASLCETTSKLFSKTHNDFMIFEKLIERFSTDIAMDLGNSQYLDPY